MAALEPTDGRLRRPGRFGELLLRQSPAAANGPQNRSHPLVVHVPMMRSLRYRRIPLSLWVR
jgi:hypothetical protein